MTGLLILCAFPVAGLALVAWVCLVKREQRRMFREYKRGAKRREAELNKWLKDRGA